MKGTRLTVIKYSHTVNKKSIYLFRCDCGNEKKLRCTVQQGEIVSVDKLKQESRILKDKGHKTCSDIRRDAGQAPANKGKFAIYQYSGSKLNKGKVYGVDDAELSRIHHGLDDPTQV